jgi:hypothetical protein
VPAPLPPWLPRPVAAGAAAGDVPALPLPPPGVGGGVRRRGVGHDDVHGVRAQPQQLVVAVVIVPAGDVPVIGANTRFFLFF